MHLCLSFNIDLKSGFQFNCAVAVPDCDLLEPAFYKSFVKCGKVGRLVFDEVLQVGDALYLFISCGGIDSGFLA